MSALFANYPFRGLRFQFKVCLAMRFRYSLRKMGKLFANSEDPDQTPRSAASDLDLHCLPITLLGISRLQWLNQFYSREIIPSHCFSSINHFTA